MSKTSEECCRHACQCKGCRLYYCADDEIHHCPGCFKSLICYRCCGLEVGVWNYFCKSCYKNGPLYKIAQGIDTCTVCNRKRRVTRHPHPFTHSSPEQPICRSCWFRRNSAK